jgi:hypothetical protein
MLALAEYKEPLELLGQVPGFDDVRPSSAPPRLKSPSISSMTKPAATVVGLDRDEIRSYTAMIIVGTPTASGGQGVADPSA